MTPHYKNRLREGWNCDKATLNRPRFHPFPFSLPALFLLQVSSSSGRIKPQRHTTTTTKQPPSFGSQEKVNGKKGVLWNFLDMKENAGWQNRLLFFLVV
jgi:hypothetical protein